MPTAARPKPAHQPTASASKRTEELGDQRAEVDAHVEDGEAGVAPPVAVLVERADDGRDVGLEEAVADRDQRQAEQQDEHEQDRSGRPRTSNPPGAIRRASAPSAASSETDSVLIAPDQQPLAAASVDESLLRVAACLRSLTS